MSEKTEKNIVAIIPAAGKATNKIMINSNLPDAMLPINGKPVIGYILEDLLSRGVSRAIVVLNESDGQTEKYISRKFKTRLKLDVVYNDNYSRGIGYSIYRAAEFLSVNESVLLYLGDTIYKGPLSFDRDFLVVSNNYEDSDKWCFVERSGQNLVFINKPQAYSGSGEALCGVYFFKNGDFFKKSVLAVEKSKKLIELSDILEKYAVAVDFELVEAEGWYDCGNVENYYKARIDFLKVRSFNSILYDDLYGHITKSSANKEKIAHEISWYEDIPPSLKIFAPRLIASEIGEDKASYSLEFYGYQSLADYFIFGSMNERLWKVVISRLFDIISLFRKHRRELADHHCYDMYYSKTLSRLNKLREDEYWDRLLDQESIEINGRKYFGFKVFQKRLEEEIKNLYHRDDLSFIHGDLCFSNILFDPSSKIFKFIDPRGSFGEKSSSGDIKYDIAKLRHSFNGFYDFLVSDLFDLEEAGDGSFSFRCLTDDYHHLIARLFDEELIARGYDLKKIKLIESLLFLSMVPLHSDVSARQKAMYLTGLKLINEEMLV